MNSEFAKKILSETEIGYDLMAGKFSETRKFFWRGIEFIKDYAKEGGEILDFGCGNGRLLELFEDKKFEYFGVDASQNLIDLAKHRYSGGNIEFSKINPSQESLAFADNFFNAVYSIAVFHHFPSVEYRQKIAKELYRITKADGYIIITVWNLWQKKYLKNILKNWWSKIFGKNNLDWNDCQITFKNNEGQIFSRFHHAFTKKELQKLFESVGFKTEMRQIIGGRNIVYIGKK